MVFRLASWAPSMPMNSITSLLDALERTELFSPEQAAEVESELVPLFHDPISLAQYLVQIEWLTEYQVDALLAEEWERLLRGPYQVLDLLGEGATSEVFRAWDTVAGRVVALKVLRPEMAERADAVEQLRHEIRVMSQLQHPNVIRTFAVSAPEEPPYLAMEYVQGMDLERLVQQEGPLSVEQACDYIRQAAQGLQHAHQTGFVHRDIKPANLFLVKPPATVNGVGRTRPSEPVIQILDWGLALIGSEEAEEQAAPKKPGSGVQGHLLGTPDYVAPEQAQDPAGTDIRADIYSLGCTLYFLLTGKPPFPGPSLMQKLMQHRTEEPRPIQELRPDVPDDLAAVLRRMMAKKPEERFPIPLLLVAPLRRFSQGAAAAPGALGRPGSSLSVVRPASSASLAQARPPSFLGIGSRSDSNGQTR